MHFKSDRSVSMAAALVCAAGACAAARGGITFIQFPGAVDTFAYSYDAVARLVGGTYVSGDGRSHGFVYDTVSAVFSGPLDVAGATDTYLRAARGGILAGTYLAGGVKRGYVYDAVGNTLKTVDAPGATDTLLFAYDPIERKATGSAVDAMGRTTTYLYDEAGNTYSNPPVGGVESNGYDTRDRVIVGDRTDAMGHTTSYQYDGNNNTITTLDLDPMGRTTTYTYDPLDRKAGVSSTDSIGRTSTYLYDTQSNILKRYDAPGALSTFLYDVGGGMMTGSFYDGAGHSTGFITEQPAPGAAGLMALGALVASRRRR